MTAYGDLTSLTSDLIECRRCPRLVAWRERVAAEKRAAYQDEDYWGRPVPGFGDPEGRLLIVGLAPAAHGANRTGRLFTGDRSGEWLYRALHRAGFASQPESICRDDRLALRDAYVTATVRCAPPDNRPTSDEIATCADWLIEEIGLLSEPRVVVTLGGLAFADVLRLAGRLGWEAPRPRPRFGHGMEVRLGEGPVLLASYHPSQQNTFTGRLNEHMFDRVWNRARDLLG